ncbi:MAG: hypothetical protein ACYC6G_00950 [Desulfobaccales bacterium]
MYRVFLYILLLMGGLLVFGATGDLVSAGRYDLLFGPNELAQSIFSLGDMVDAKMALQSALAREYGAANTAEAMQLLSDRYNAAHPVTITIPDLYINIPINTHNPLDGVVVGSRVMQDYYAQLFNAMAGDAHTSLP